jgi:hypothetical protein
MKKCGKCKLDLDLEHFNKHKINKDGFNFYCKSCVKLRYGVYSNTEHGYMTNLYRNLRRRVLQKRYENYSEYEKAKRRCYITREEFFSLWEKHKIRYGYICALSGDSIVFKTSSASGSKTNNGISVDRLNPRIGYTLENTIFVSNLTNQMKCNVTKELCKAIIKAHEERGL